MIDSREKTSRQVSMFPLQIGRLSTTRMERARLAPIPWPIRCRNRAHARL